MNLFKLGLGTIGIVLFISALIGGFAWTYSLNTWLVFFGKEPIIVFWQGMLLGLTPVIGQSSIIVAIITWILFLFLYQNQRILL